MKVYKIISWNVNGLRAILKKGFSDFLNNEEFNILGIQETKLQESQIPDIFLKPTDLNISWSHAEKKGYSGTAIFSKVKPKKTKTIFEGQNIFNGEGRIIELHFEKFILLNIYFPNGQKNEERLNYKMDFYKNLLIYLKELKKINPKIIIMGDVNTAHKEIDLKHPKANSKRSGFLPIEREWIDKLIKQGFKDSFRIFNQEPDNYTWWSYISKARERNAGWRIDYFFVSEELTPYVKESTILKDFMGSDHCPIKLTIEI